MLTVFNTFKEIEDSGADLAILPIGSIEQHSLHLPLGTDWIIAQEMGMKLAERLDAYLLPALPYGNSQEHMGFMGTITLRPSTLAAVVEDIVLSLRHHGIKKVVILSAHGGNWILKPTIRDLNYRYPDITVIWNDGALPGEEEKIPRDIHAGRDETSIILAIDPELVREEGVDFTPDVGQEYLDYVGIEANSPKGVWGEPTLASKELGEKNMKEAVERQVEYIRATLAKVEELRGERKPSGRRRGGKS
ncbi:MAG: creatininase family protein [bacterium]